MGLLSNLRDKYITGPVAQRITESLTKAANPDQLQRWTQPIGYNDQVFHKINLGSNVTTDQLRNMSRLYDVARSCINIRKRQINQLNWDIIPIDRELKGKHDADIPTIRAFFSTIGGYNTKMRKLLDMMVEDYLVLDGVVLERRRTRGGSFLGLLPADPATIKILVTDQGTTPQPPDYAYEQWIRGTKTGSYTADQLIYDMLNPRTDNPYGLSPMETLIMATEEALRTRMFSLSYFTDGNVPEGFYELPETWDTNQIQQFQSFFDSLMSGDSRMQNKVKFLPATGGKGYQPTKEFDFAGMEPYLMWLMRLTASLFGIMPQELGFTDGVNRSNGEEQTEIVKRNSIQPMANAIQEVFNEILWKEKLALTDQKGNVVDEIGPFPELQFKFLNLDKKDEFIDSQVTQNLIGIGAISVDEYREEHGLAPIGLGPYINTGGGPVLVSQLLAATTVSGTTVSGTNTTADEDDDNTSSVENAGQAQETSPEQDIKRWEKKALNDLKEGKPFRKFVSNVIPTTTSQAIEQSLYSATRRIHVKKAFDPFLGRTTEEPKKVVDSFIDDLILTNQVTAFRDQVHKAFTEQIANLSDATIREAVENISKVSDHDIAKVRAVIEKNWGSFDNFLNTSSVSNFLKGVYNTSGNHVLEKLGVKGTFGVFNPQVIENLKDRSNLVIKSVDDTTKEQLSKIISKGVESGKSWQDIAKTIRDTYPDISQYRSELIARMETANAVNMAELDFYKKNGLTQKRWVLASSHKTEDLCDDNADAGLIPVDQPFPSGHVAPPGHVNCMCTEHTEIPEDFIENGPNWLGE